MILSVTRIFVLPSARLHLQLGYNRIASWTGVAELAALADLGVVYLEHNPIAREWEYRIKLKRLVPQLTQIDAVEIRR
jgi:hypothetical protein